MNDFQKRALAYNAYRALRKLAALNKKAEGGSEQTPMDQAVNAKTGDPAKINPPAKPRTTRATKRDWWNNIPRGKKIKNGGGCCGR